MKTVSTELRNHLAQECTTLARCWHIVRKDGREFYFTSFDEDLLIGGHNYISTSGFSTSAIDTGSDMTVDNQDITGIFDDDSITIEDLRAGLFDYADVYVFLVNWADLTQGVLKLRRGKFGECQATPQGFFKVELRGLAQLLQQPIVDLYGPACRADLGDSDCKYNVAAVTSIGHITSVVDDRHVNVDLDTALGSYTNDSWFKHGVITFTSGDNSGKGLEVKSWNHTTGTLEFYVPPGYPLVVGVTFTITPGCDKTLPTCRDTFANILNRQAEDYLPGDDQAFSYPDVGGN